MKKIALLLCSVMSLGVAQAQSINITGAGFSYTEDFNTLDTNASNSSNLPNGWAIKEIGTSGSANDMYRTGIGTANAGDVYSFGSAGSTDRALGSIASGTNSPSYGARFDNTSSTDTITRILMSYTVEQWRAGDTASKLDSVLFMYSLVADSVGDTVAANWIEVPALMMNSVTPVASSTNGNPLDGNTNTGIVSDSFDVIIPPGAHIIIKWFDKNLQNADDGLAVDDLSVTFKNEAIIIDGIGSLNMQRMPLTVLGTATGSSMRLAYTTTGGSYQLSIQDLTGRTVYTERVQTQPGTQQLTLSGLNLTPGMYIIRLTDGNNLGVTKAIVE